MSELKLRPPKLLQGLKSGLSRDTQFASVETAAYKAVPSRFKVDGREHARLCSSSPRRCLKAFARIAARARGKHLETRAESGVALLRA